MSYLSASVVVIHYEEALYQVYAPLPFTSLMHLLLSDRLRTKLIALHETAAWTSFWASGHFCYLHDPLELLLTVLQPTSYCLSLPPRRLRCHPCLLVCLSVCLSVNRINKNYWSNRVDLSDLDPKSRSLEFKGQNRLFADNSVQSCRTESRQKLKCRLLNFLNISRCDYGRKILQIGGSQMSEGPGRNEIDYNSL